MATESTTVNVDKTVGLPEHAAVVSPNDSADLATPAAGLFIGTTGDVRVTTMGGETVTFHGVPVGFLPVWITRVWSTGTTASYIMALW